MFSKTILNSNFGNSSSTSTSSESSALTLSEKTITAEFYRNNEPAGTKLFFTMKFYKMGSLITMVLKRVITTMSTAQSWRSLAVIPEGYRPSFIALQSFSPSAGSGGENYNADISGGIIARPNGDLEIYRELPNGSGTWDGNDRGWQTLSMSWY